MRRKRRWTATETGTASTASERTRCQADCPSRNAPPHYPHPSPPGRVGPHSPTSWARSSAPRAAPPGRTSATRCASTAHPSIRATTWWS